MEETHSQQTTMMMSCASLIMRDAKRRETINSARIVWEAVPQWANDKCCEPPTTHPHHLRIIIKWLNENLFVERSPKQRQLMLIGTPNIGKTRLVAAIAKFARIFRVPTETQWWDGYCDDNFDLILLDELPKKIMYPRANVLNSVLDGSVVALEQRGVQRYEQTKNLPVLLASNYTLDQHFQKGIPEGPQGSLRLLEIY